MKNKVRCFTLSGSVYDIDWDNAKIRQVSASPTSEQHRIKPEWCSAEAVEYNGIGTKILVRWLTEGELVRCTVTSPVVRDQRITDDGNN